MTENKKRARELAEKDLFDTADALLKATEKTGQPCYLVDADNLSSIPPDEQSPGVVMTMGMRGDLTKREADIAARDWHKFIQRFPRSKFFLAIAGYDDDPRELYEFPEVTRYFRRFARKAGLDNMGTARRWLSPFSFWLLAACGVFGENIRQRALRNAPPRTTAQ